MLYRENVMQSLLTEMRLKAITGGYVGFLVFGIVVQLLCPG